MKVTECFQYVRVRPDRLHIRDEWIALTLLAPAREETQVDGRIRRWAYIEEAGKYLRVITLDDGETVHNAFVDRRYRPE